MNQATLKAARSFLVKSQRELAANLGVSIKALQSYEQGWRKIPGTIERQIFFYLSMLNRKSNYCVKNCWEIVDCDEETRNKCLAWQVGAGKECWLVIGNLCRDSNMDSWRKKRNCCFRCAAFLQHLQVLKGNPLHKEILNTCC